MKHKRIHPLIIIALFLSSIANGLNAYQYFGKQDTSSGWIFTTLCVVTLFCAIASLFINKTMNKRKSFN
ncbi:hypothetical protein [Oceanobacillus iheyensis HTE831]|uniref:Uncharacterized protein n=1 Tax=Oceanobacillus iheyensis (strain DSM 14371 / CIP 107618 / JCM 11309 / KCTC 3954 / HTE831) TaxID=221109 RepID=Q8ERG2_OCEIH|nr:hypothetical protein [Oceanobacillus iheyensis]BAC13296.1 hypothetical protein [Oceanobacillus iheyensis HTE831]